MAATRCSSAPPGPAPATSPSALEHVDEEVRRGGPGRRPGGPARSLSARPCTASWSSATWATRRRCRRSPPRSALELGRPDLAERAAALAGACWRSAPVRAAAASPEVHRELPVGVLVGDVVVSGAVDLLYRDGDELGRRRLQDRRADADERRVLRERYTPQGAAYALAVEAATGGVVREVVFVAARGGRVAPSSCRSTTRCATRARARDRARPRARVRAVDADELAVQAG